MEGLAAASHHVSSSSFHPLLHLCTCGLGCTQLISTTLLRCASGEACNRQCMVAVVSADNPLNLLHDEMMWAQARLKCGQQTHSDYCSMPSHYRMGISVAKLSGNAHPHLDQ
jgi:hypothetical protein